MEKTFSVSLPSNPPPIIESETLPETLKENGINKPAEEKKENRINL